MAANRFKKRVKSCTCDRQTLTQAESDKQLTQWKQYAVSNKRKKNKSKKKYNAYSDIGRVSVVLIHKYSHCCKMYGCVCVPCLKWCLCVCVYCDLYVICVCVFVCVQIESNDKTKKNYSKHTNKLCEKLITSTSGWNGQVSKSLRCINNHAQMLKTRNRLMAHRLLDAS